MVPPEWQRVEGFFFSFFAENIYFNIMKEVYSSKEKNEPRNEYNVPFICHMQEQVIVLAEEGHILN